MSAQSGAGVQTLVDQLVGRLIQQGFIRDPRVEQAFRSVHRHLFVPGVPPEQAYSEEAIITHRGPDGRPTSSSSMPGIVAAMLEQMDVPPGLRILEVGAGTGHNAGLLAYLVGPAGRVTTVDIDDEVAQEARDRLVQSGLANVRVVSGDGWLGAPEDAPFDRIEATVGVWDLSPHWVSQLHEGGILLVPLWLRTGLQASVAFRKEHASLRSVSVEPCGFMRLRGAYRGPEEYISVGEWSAAMDESSAESIQILGELVQMLPKVEDAPSLPRGWQTYFLLSEPQAVNLTHRDDWRHGLVGVFDPRAGSLAAVEERMGSQENRILVFGSDEALGRLRRYMAKAGGVDLRKLSIQARPSEPAVAHASHRWVIRRPAFTFSIDSPDE